MRKEIAFTNTNRHMASFMVEVIRLSDDTFKMQMRIHDDKVVAETAELPLAKTPSYSTIFGYCQDAIKNLI